MTDIPTSEPVELVAGDTWRWRREDLEADPSTWTLTYHFASAAFAFSVTATADGEAFAVNVPAATTAGYAPGVYTWDAYIDDGSDRFRVDNGQMEVRPDLATVGALELRSNAQQILEALEAMILGKASRDQASYTIGNRSLNRLSPEELITWRDRYAAIVANEEAAAKIENGLKSGRIVLTRFVGQ